MTCQQIVRRVVLAVVATVTVGCPELAGQAWSAAESKAFDRGDRESRELISSINCLNRLWTAVQEKRVVEYESWMQARQCVLIDRHYVWVTIGIDTLFTRVTRVSAYDLTTSAPYAGRLDTAGVTAIARAEWVGTGRIQDRFVAAKRDAVPLTFRFDGDSIEVWLLPLQLLTGNPWSLGGEYGVIFSPDGRTLVREVDRFDEFRATTVPDTGLVRIGSRQARIPSLSEFLLANQLNARDRSIVIELPWGSSALAKGAGSPWVQVVGKKP